MGRKAKVEKVLPTNRQHGIPAMMTKRIDTTFWGTTYESVDVVSKEHLKGIGLGNTDWIRRKRKDDYFCADQVYKSKDIDAEASNARQAFQKIKGKDIKCDFTTVQKCADEAPSDINVYTDGSYKNNRRAFFSLAGAGVWWHKRNLEVDPLSPSEMEMAFGTQEREGVALRTALAGHGGSSTRAEIAAGILASQAPKAVNIGSDSQSFVSKANHIARLAKDSKKPKRLWSKQ